MSKRSLMSVWIVSMFGSAGPVLAADAVGGAEESAPALMEIVVTAQKRSEKLQDVPIAITAISPQSLTNNKVETTADLQVLVPALVYNDLGGFAEPFMRGVGTDVTFVNADPSVATYVDGAFVSFNQATIQNLLGVQRIEVLEGPQGTLYGRNAVGGAINVYSLTPTHSTDIAASLTTGNYARKEATMHVSGGLTDQLAIGVYFAGSLRNRYISDLTYAPIFDPHTPSHENQWGARIKAVYTPTDWLTLTGSYERTKVASVETGALREISPSALGYVINPAIPPIIERYVYQSVYPTFNVARQSAGVLREDIALPWANILGISNYRNVDIDAADDDNATGSQILALNSPEEKSQQYSQELQLISLPSSKIQWIAGLYFFHEWGGLLPQGEIAPLFFPFVLENNSRVTTKSYAEFAQATIPLDALAEGLRFTVGGRYTTDQKELQSSNSFLIGGKPVAPDVVYPNREHKWSKFTPKVTLDYKIHDVLTYLTYSEGFKSGVYNLSALTQANPVNPESLKSYELGAKAELWERRIVWNSALYFLDWKDVQVESITASSGGATVLANAAAAKAHGVESTLTLAATEALTLHGAVAWEHSKYTNYQGYQGANPVSLAPLTVNATGNELQRAPKWVVTAGAEYRKEMPFGGTLHSSADYYYNGGYYWTPQNTARQSAYSLVNVTLGYAPAAQWDVSAWVKNLTNTYYATTTIYIPGLSELAQDAPPRMYGLTASYKFQ